jgi:DNA-binding HxlR family transcriptional regulator
MSIIGGAWTPNILWYLRGGPRRFSELRMDIPQISPKVLTRCLRELEDCGVVERRVMPTSPPSVEYSLNDLGRRLVPAIEASAAVSAELKARQSDSVSGVARRPKHFRATNPSGAKGGSSETQRRRRREAGRSA